jgi:hypothetical protein
LHGITFCAYTPLIDYQPIEDDMAKPTKPDMMENALREIAANAAHKGGEWASEQAFAMLEFIDGPPQRETASQVRRAA